MEDDDILSKPVPPPPSDDLLARPVPPPPAPEPINKTDLVDTIANVVEQSQNPTTPTAMAVTEGLKTAIPALRGIPMLMQALDAGGRFVRTVEATQPTLPGQSGQPNLINTSVNLNPLTAVPAAGANMIQNVVQGHLPIGGAGKPIVPDFWRATKSIVQPELAPTPEQGKEQFMFGKLATKPSIFKKPSEGQEVQDVKPGTFDYPGSPFNNAGNDVQIDWNQLGRHGADFLGTLFYQLTRDQVTYLTAGLSPAAKAAQSARATAVVEKGLGLAGPVEEAAAAGAKSLAEANYTAATGRQLPTFADAATEKAFTVPTRAAQVARGDVEMGLGAPGGLPVFSMTMPKALAPLAGVVDALESVNIGMKGWSFVEPNVRQATQLLGKTLLDRNTALYKEAFQQTVVPAYSKAVETGLPEREIQRASRFAEMLDPDGNLRAGPELADMAAKRGFNVQTELPAEVSPRVPEAAIGSSPAETAALHEAERVKGMAHFQKQMAEDLEAFSAYTPEQMAAAYNLMRKGNEFAARVQSLYKELTGNELTPLNAAILERPRTITARLVEIADEENALNVPGAIKDEAFIEKAGSLATEKEALIAERPEAIRKYNAVSAYRPGRLSGAAREGLPQQNPLLRRVTVGGGIESSERSMQFNERSGLAGVKLPVYRTEAEITKGMATRATDGVRAAAKSALQSINDFAYKYLTPKGFKEITEDIMRTSKDYEFFEPNSYKAFERMASTDYPKAATNRMLDQGVLRLYDTTPERAWRAVQSTADEPVIVSGKKGDNHSDIYKHMTDDQKHFVASRGDENFGYVDQEGKWYSRDEAIATTKANKEDTLVGHAPNIRAAMAENADAPRLLPAMRTSASFNDLKAAFKKAGGEGDLARLIDPAEVKNLLDGKTSVGDLFSVGDTNSPFDKTPYNRALATLNDQSVYVHGQVARDLEEFKKLGNDPYQFVRFLGAAAPHYTWLLNTWKKLQTYAGPQFIAYNLRNQIGDVMRMYMGGLTDGSQVWKEWADLFPRLAEYRRSGDINVFNGMQIMGPGGLPVEGAEAMRLVEQSGIIGRGEIAGDVLRGSQASTLQKSIQDQSLLQQISPKAAQAKEFVAKKWENLKGLQQAREDANRVSGFFSRLRAGDTPIEAGMRVEQAMFDYKRLSPAANFLRQTGFVPFISWQSKNIPFTIKFALEHPGQFMGMVRTMDAVSAGQLPMSQVPEWMKGKHLMPLSSGTDERGNRQMTVLTDSGVVPFTDAIEMFNSPGRYALQLAGPVLKPLFIGLQMAKENDPTKTTGQDYLEQTAQAVGGRPLQMGQKLYKLGEINPQTGQKQTVGDIIQHSLLPINTQQINLDQSRSISVGSAKQVYLNAAIKLNQANTTLQFWKRKAQEAQATANDATAISPNDPQFAGFVRAAEQAKADYETAQKNFEQIRKDTEKVDEVYRRMKLVK